LVKVRPDAVPASGRLYPTRRPGPAIEREHVEGDGATVFEHVCKLGLEGIVSKRKGSRYMTALVRFLSKFEFAG
jgi:hypothetical protein